MSIRNTDAAVGDGVVLDRDVTTDRVNAGVSDRLFQGTQFMITRMYGQRVQIRTFETFVPTWGGPAVARSYTVDKTDVTLDPSAGPANGVPSRARRMGKKPEDTEAMTYIDITDPGIQWLFEDMGKYATGQGWCPQYDALCAKLGIPGRPRPFSVTRTINGITVSAQVEARNQAEANQKFDAALTPQTDPETTPSDSETLAA